MHPRTHTEFVECLRLLNSNLIKEARAMIPSILNKRIGGSDLAQIVLTEAYTAYDQYQAVSEIPVESWLRRLLRARLIDLYRKHVVAERRSLRKEAHVGSVKSWQAISQSLSRDEGDRVLIRQEEMEIVDIVLSSLNELDQQIVIERTQSGLTHAQLAEKFGMQEEAVKKRFGRALLAMRKQLRQLYPVDEN